MSETIQNHNQMISIREVAILVGVLIQTIRRWTAKGNFPSPHRYSAILLRWEKNIVVNWINEHKPKNN